MNRLTADILQPLMIKAQQRRVANRQRTLKSIQELTDKIEQLRQDLIDDGYDIADGDEPPKKSDDEYAWEILQHYKNSRHTLNQLTREVKNWTPLPESGEVPDDELTLAAVQSGELDVSWLEHDHDNWDFYVLGNGQHMLWRNLVRSYRELTECGVGDLE